MYSVHRYPECPARDWRPGLWPARQVSEAPGSAGAPARDHVCPGGFMFIGTPNAWAEQQSAFPWDGLYGAW